MATKKPSVTAKPETNTAQSKTRAVAEAGVYDHKAFASYMSALMSDVVVGSVTPEVCNAGCNAGGKLLKIVEMQLKYGGKMPALLAGPAKKKQAA